MSKCIQGAMQSNKCSKDSLTLFMVRLEGKTAARVRARVAKLLTNLAQWHPLTPTRSPTSPNDAQ
eukprot:4129827-Prorocentrum_lima.AAC.1